jgi:tetratricopeptide (TPR) repeat protein
MRNIIYKSLFSLICTCFLFSCNKSDYLNSRPNQSLVVPESIEDLQALLDNDQVMNGAGVGGIVPSLGEVACTDYFLKEDDLFGFISPLERNAYTWQKDVFNGEHIADWNLPYRAVFYANVALDGLNKIEVNASNQVAWNNVKGSALFDRAFMFYQLAQIFAPPYDSSTAQSDYGVPLRLKGDINESIQRATLQQSYDRIISDLKEAISLLPAKPLCTTRPSKSSTYALLAKVYLSLRDYNAALLYADSCLQIQPELLDYNTLDVTATFPIPQFNEETIFYAILVWHDIITPYIAGIDTNLYSSYLDNDLRKQVFFNDGGPLNSKVFRGSYTNDNLFGGIATDEMYLTRAECYVRTGNVAGALNDLNTLLAKRYLVGTFTPFETANADEALRFIIAERRKELVMRGVRWMDLRRLNKEEQFATTLTRVVNGTKYSLSPNDSRYTYPIPDEVINFNPSMPQNPR